MLFIMQNVKANFMSTVGYSRIALGEAAEQAFTIA
jgi:hypothetical protein